MFSLTSGLVGASGLVASAWRVLEAATPREETASLAGEAFSSRRPVPSALPTPTPDTGPTARPAGQPGATVARSEILSATADTFVHERRRGSTYGGRPALEADNRPHIKRILIRFRLPDLRPETRLTAATLRLYVASRSEEAGAIHLVAGDWSEATTSWSNAPRIGNKIAELPNPAAAGTWREADVKAAVDAGGDISFYVVTSSSDGVDYRSREAKANPPQLVVRWEGQLPAPTDAASPTRTPTATRTPTPTPTMTPRSTPSPVTSPDPGTAPVFVGAGDIASCSSSGDEATAGLLDNIAGTVFTLGDNVYSSGTASEFADCYHPTWGRHKGRTRPSAGNHDYGTSRAAGYFDYFNGAGSSTGPAGDRDKGYYSYDLGRWHIVVINSNCSEVGGCDAGSPQEQWLRDDLSAHPADCTLAYWHHPRFSSGTTHGNHDEMQPIWQALYDAGADVVLSGHEHNYERFAPQTPSGALDAQRGIREFVVGTGGRSHYGFGTPLPNSEVRNSNTFGVLRLVLRPTGYDWQFVPVTGGTTFTDAGSAACVATNAGQQLRPLLEDVPSATGYRYGARDDRGNSMDTLKIIESAQGGYLGVYHTQVNGVFSVKVGTSTDLLNWTFRADLDAHASQATLARLANDAYLVAYEKDSATGNWIRIRYYPDLASLLSGSFQDEFDAPRTLAPSAEGTPNIYSALLSPDIRHSQIDVGFHYFRDAVVDRQARGTLTDFSSWTAHEETRLNQAFEALGVQGNAGDRDYMVFGGKEFNIHEAQSVRGDWGSWRAYLYDYDLDQVSALNVRTHGGSSAFGNPTFTNITSPNGRRAVVATYFVFAQGAAAGEGGELIFYQEY